MVGQAGYTPERVHTVAKVHIDKVGDSFKITGIELETDATIPEIEERRFLEIAEAAKKGCPVSQALAGTDIKLRATLAR
jgi:osmotically inducible protein OsmC